MRRVSAPRDPWGRLFPIDEAQRAAKFLADTWRFATRESPHMFLRTLKEPVLTEHLWVFLDRLALSRGKLDGDWSYEHYRFEVDAGGRKVKRLRQDIRYFSNAGGMRLQLVFEFKKLRAKSDSWRTYQGEHGMRRFVDGFYAKHQPIAAMVAMTLDDDNHCIDGLKRLLLVDGTRDSLKMLPDASGAYLREPSAVFGGTAIFDTEHRRPMDQAPEHGATTVAHIFLPLPSEP